MTANKLSEKRASLTKTGNMRDQLNTPYRDGTTHMIFEPLDFIACDEPVDMGKIGCLYFLYTLFLMKK